MDLKLYEAAQRFTYNETNIWNYKKCLMGKKTQAVFLGKTERTETWS